MTYFCTLSSGSEGNAALYVSGRQRILIDAGKNTRYLSDCLRQLALSTADLTHILITPSHTDHVSALPVLLKHTRATLVCSHETFTAIAHRLPMGVPVLLFTPGEGFSLGDVPVRTFATSHDAPGSCGYVLGKGQEQAAVCTDLGTMSGEIFETIRGSRVVLLECNHDAEMVKNGPYPISSPPRWRHVCARAARKPCFWPISARKTTPPSWPCLPFGRHCPRPGWKPRCMWRPAAGWESR